MIDSDLENITWRKTLDDLDNMSEDQRFFLHVSEATKPDKSEMAEDIEDDSEDEYDEKPKFLL